MAYALYLVVRQAIEAVPTLQSHVHVELLTTLTIFALLEFVFNSWAWRLLCLVSTLHIYDFAGTYEGDSAAGDGNRYPAKLTIRQNWSNIEIAFESGDASSKSFSASVIRDRLAKGQVELVYNYFAPGTHVGEDRVGAHYGTAMLKRSFRGAKLEGDYFTERKRDSFGQLSMKRVQKSSAA